jgi:hypothetical protein
MKKLVITVTDPGTNITYGGVLEELDPDQAVINTPVNDELEDFPIKASAPASCPEPIAAPEASEPDPEKKPEDAQ